MRRLFVLCAVALSAAACADRSQGVVIKEEEAMSVAYDRSVELATAVAEAKSYEEFAGARAELEAYEEAMRTQVGGEEYEAFLMSANEVLKNLK